MTTRALRRVGHKGADAIVPGNTIASFEAAVAIGVEMIEFDVLWTLDGPAARLDHAHNWPSLSRIRRDAAIGRGGRSPLVVAHDWPAAARAEQEGTALTLDRALAAFTAPPLDRVEIDCDLKLPGREQDLVAALREHDLIERAMVSTMELSSLERIARLEPRLRLGWTYPRVTRDWTGKRWAVPGMLAALAAMRRRLPGLAARQIPRLGIDAVWVYHPLATSRLAEVTAAAGVELIAWTVDDTAAMARLLDHGVTGLCSNDPRLFQTFAA